MIKIPHRISGFFEIVDEFDGMKISDPERIGSRGAGFNLNSFGITEIRLEEVNDSGNLNHEIYINKELLNERAETSYYILKYCLKLNKGLDGHKIKIFHDFDLPVGCGFGASGSGALGCVYGLNYILNLNLQLSDLGRIAHIAEVINRTGLGTVCGQLGGGLSILLEPGYPCSYEKIKPPNDLIVICGSFGTIHTKSILNDPKLNVMIKNAGRKALSNLLKNPNLKNFTKLSYKFVKESRILKILNLSEIEELLYDLNKLNIIGASMNQLGRSVFIFCDKDSENEVQDLLTSYKPNLKTFKSSINESDKILIKRM